VKVTPEVRAITFDVGGTLIEPWPSVGHVYAGVAGEHGHGAIDPEALNRQFRKAWQAKRGFDHSRGAWLRLVEETFDGLIAGRVEAALFDELYRRFATPMAWRVFDDAWPTLKQLQQQGFKLGVISNWDERLRQLLANLNLTRYIECLVISCEVGAAKPSPRIFERARDALAAPAEHILHVGDNFDEDVCGGRVARFQVLHLNRRRGEAALDQISSLLEVLSHLRKMG
jgi:putative hydrolase of the HAD superfamily